METSFYIETYIDKKIAEQFEQDIMFTLKTRDLKVRAYDDYMNVEIYEDDLSFKDLLNLVQLIKEYEFTDYVKNFVFNKW